MNSNNNTPSTGPAHPARHSNFWINFALFLSVLAVPLGLHFLLNPDTAFAAVSKQVEATGAMQVPRTGHTATLLPDGGVLIVGGSGAGGVLDSIEVYDRTNKTFSTVGDPNAPTKLTQARTGHTATLVTLADGTSRVIIAGGVNGQAVPQPSIEIFDPATGNMTNTDNAGQPLNLAAARYLHTATVLL